jgi:PAS domain-containing protein
MRLTQAKVIRELDEKEKKYSSLFERSVDPIFLATEDFKLLNVNKSFLKVFGYELQEETQLLYAIIYLRMRLIMNLLLTSAQRNGTD